MNPRSRFNGLAMSLAVLVATGLACNLSGPAAQSPMLATPAATPTSAPLPTESVAATTTPPPVEPYSPTPAASQTPAGEAIVLSATGGNLNIRRGPGQAYAVVGFLLNGQAATASGRNEPTC